jgi:hypothetical protein
MRLEKYVRIGSRTDIITSFNKDYHERLHGGKMLKNSLVTCFFKIDIYTYHCTVSYLLITAEYSAKPAV